MMNNRRMSRMYNNALNRSSLYTSADKKRIIEFHLKQYNFELKAADISHCRYDQNYNAPSKGTRFANHGSDFIYTLSDKAITIKDPSGEVTKHYVFFNLNGHERNKNVKINT